MNNTTKIIMGVAIGAAAGLAMGILFAPEKGSKTRQKITEEATDIFAEVKEKLQCKESNTPV
jgi:gas vesicle protein